MIMESPQEVLEDYYVVIQGTNDVTITMTAAWAAAMENEYVFITANGQYAKFPKAFVQKADVYEKADCKKLICSVELERLDATGALIFV